MNDRRNVFIVPFNNFISTLQNYSMVFIETIANIGYILYAYWEEKYWTLRVKGGHYRELPLLVPNDSHKRKGNNDLKINSTLPPFLFFRNYLLEYAFQKKALNNLFI